MRQKITNSFKKITSLWILAAVLVAFLPCFQAYAQTKVLTRGNPNLPYMSLTFDDGGSVENVKSVLETLDKYEVHASFFFLGSFIEQNPELMKAIADKGHDVGNHSYSHPYFTKVSYNKIISELSSSANAFKKATGYDMKPYVRPPYGAKNNTVLNAISDAGYTHTVLWNVDTNDWKKKTSNEIVNHVLANAGNGNIVLMHTTANSNSAKALPKIIEGLQSSGYKLVSISELMEASSYTAPKLGVDEISEVEFLNNLLYTKTGSFLSTAEEIKKSATELGLIEGTSNISFSKAYTKEEMIAMIKKLYPLKSDIDKKFANVEFKNSNLEQIIKLLKE